MGIPPDSPPALDPAFSNAALIADMPPAAEAAPPMRGRTSHACRLGHHTRRAHSRTDGGTCTEVANAASATDARAGDDAGDKRGHTIDQHEQRHAENQHHAQPRQGGMTMTPRGFFDCLDVAVAAAEQRQAHAVEFEPVGDQSTDAGHEAEVAAFVSRPAQTAIEAARPAVKVSGNASRCSGDKKHAVGRGRRFLRHRQPISAPAGVGPADTSTTHLLER